MTAPASTRMAWLDALRGLAVLLVVYAHLTRYVFTDLRAVTGEWLHAGTAGVMLFFLVSGYIIPASLERHGDPRAFWRSRFARLLPLYLAVGAAVVVLGLTGQVPLDPWLADHPGTAVAAHATMLPFLLGVPLVTPLFWTLTFEMVFYLLVTALFTLGLHRFAGVAAASLAGAGVLLAPLPAPLTGGTALTAGVALVLVAGLVAVCGRQRAAAVAGAAALGVLALALTIVQQDPAHAWDGLLILAVMFTGMLIHRADSGRSRWWPVAVTGSLVAGALLHNWFAELIALDAFTPRYAARSVITLTLFAGLFALGMVTRRRRTPKVLAWIGVVSYSVYLVHWPLIEVLRDVLGAGRIPDVVLTAGFLALTGALSWVTHRWIELPGQRLGRRRTDASARQHVQVVLVEHHAEHVAERVDH